MIKKLVALTNIQFVVGTPDIISQVPGYVI